ncbi:hypothetical protein SEA_CBORCH11_76 [Mycobacterium phage Cborch11]|nr:hypothetical protein SEA_CBORCH11_76 [Mycobacterium phage Cborch11]
MKIEDQARPGVDSSEVEEVLLRDGYWYPVRDNSFRIYSPVELTGRTITARNNGAYLRFRNAEDGRWIEAPLASLVAVNYRDTPSCEEISETDGAKGK